VEEWEESNISMLTSWSVVRKNDTGFIYAMKVMKKDQIASDAKIKQIMNERHIMEELGDHPFVVKLHYAFQSVITNQ
jgi:serine/threonine protein kinase